MADTTFNTTAGQTIARELMIAYLNTGEASKPVWSPLGKRVEESSAEMDWGEETIQDVTGKYLYQPEKAYDHAVFRPLQSGRWRCRRREGVESRRERSERTGAGEHGYAHGP